jgi:hypothetical protein
MATKLVAVMDISIESLPTKKMTGITNAPLIICAVEV